MNDAQKRGLARLMLRWPDRRGEIRQKCTEAPGFLELCEAYETACEACDFWGKATSQVGYARAEEYRVLAFEIAQDIDHAFT